MKRKHVWILFAFCLTAPLMAEEKKDAAALGWRHESELSISAASGNADSQIYRAKQTTKYLWSLNMIELSAHYLYGLSNGGLSARDWNALSRYERSVSERWGLFIADSWEGNTFIGYDYRTNVDLGSSYYLIPGNKKVDYVLSELGYRLRYEHHPWGTYPVSLTSHVIRGYLEGVIAFSDTTDGKVWLELLPDLSHHNNYQMNFEASVSVAMTSILSLKFAYQGHYRNQPIVVGKKRFDSLVTSALLAKF